MYRLRLIFCLTVVLAAAHGQGFLKTDGRDIVDSTGNAVLLRGFGLGGWLVQEGYMWNIHGFFGSPSNIENEIINLVGEENSETFYQAYYDNYITEADIAYISSRGFNALRVPFHYKFFSTSYSEYIEDGFNILAPVLQWCSTYGVYLILDMHCAPGAQNTNDFSDSDGEYARLWTNLSNRDWTRKIWRHIAEYYADEEWIAGYDLINEPVLSGGFSSWELRQFYNQVKNEIREVDTTHIIFIEGNWYGNDFTNLTPPFDDNMAYSFHHYVGPSHQVSWVGQYTSMSETYNVPLWVGEYGENSNHWVQNKTDLFEKHNISWSLWNYKHNGSITPAMRVEVPSGFEAIVDYWNNGGEPPSSDEAMVGLMALVEAYKFENCVINAGLIAALSDDDYVDIPKPFTKIQVPGTFEAVHYDIGANGIAYYDIVYEDPDKFGSNSQSWNTGWVYRNDGVDIEYSDVSAGQEYNVGWIESGEWLLYTVQADFTGSYQFSFSTSSPDDYGQIIISVEEQTGSKILLVPNTDGYQNWVWTDTVSMNLLGGENIIRLQALNGGFNLKSINIEGTNPNPIPSRYSIRNYPNPFNTHTTFYFPNIIENSGEIRIYDINGNLVQDIQLIPNQSSATWDGKDSFGFAAGSGVYVYRLKFDREKSTGKITLIR